VTENLVAAPLMRAVAHRRESSPAARRSVAIPNAPEVARARRGGRTAGRIVYRRWPRQLRNQDANGRAIPPAEEPRSGARDSGRRGDVGRDVATSTRATASSSIRTKLSASIAAACEFRATGDSHQ
jgi:hypothetical protein